MSKFRIVLLHLSNPLGTFIQLRNSIHCEFDGCIDPAVIASISHIFWRLNYSKTVLF